MQGRARYGPTRAIPGDAAVQGAHVPGRGSTIRGPTTVGEDRSGMPPLLAFADTGYLATQVGEDPYGTGSPAELAGIRRFGIRVGEDLYGSPYLPAKPGDRFIEVIARDPSGPEPPHLQRTSIPNGRHPGRANTPSFCP